MAFKNLKKLFSGPSEADNEYLEIDLEQAKEKDNKVVVRLFTLKTYDDVNEVLAVLREGFTIAILDIKTLRQKDSIELKRAVAKVKKTIDALEGSIAGFGENMVIATPSFAKIYKEAEKVAPKKDKYDMY